jgi:hypothetical protein
MADLEITDSVAQADIAAIEGGLAAHAQEAGIQPLEFRPLAVLSRDRKGNIDAGLYGKTFGLRVI